MASLDFQKLLGSGFNLTSPSQQTSAQLRSGGQVQGVSTPQSVVVAGGLGGGPNLQPQTDTPRPSGDGGGGTGDSEYQQLLKMQQSGGLNPSQQDRFSQLYEQHKQPTPSQSIIDYDALIAPALKAFEDAVTPAQSEYEANVASVEASKTKGEGKLQSSLTEAQTTAGSQKKQLTGQTESAIDEARRQFAEMRQGFQSRYGRSVGTGGFAETYLGGETLRGISQKRTALTTAIQTIDDRLSQVKSVTDIALQDLEQQAEAQKLQVKSQLDNALQQIRTAKGQLLSQKAQLAQQAMQFYQQQVAQVNASNSAFKQQLLRDQMAAEQQLALAKQKASSEVQKISLQNLGTTEAPNYNWVNATNQTVNPMTPTAGGKVTGLGGEDDLTKRLQALNY